MARRHYSRSGAVQFPQDDKTTCWLRKERKKRKKKKKPLSSDWVIRPWSCLQCIHPYSVVGNSWKHPSSMWSTASLSSFLLQTKKNFFLVSLVQIRSEARRGEWLTERRWRSLTKEVDEFEHSFLRCFICELIIITIGDFFLFCNMAWKTAHPMQKQIHKKYIHTVRYGTKQKDIRL